MFVGRTIAYGVLVVASLVSFGIGAIIALTQGWF
ncbi:hypothetical protein MLDJOKPK_00249 [Salmonella phage SPAsTU]|nr:hypothetical protein MLDJOKPK_00249 [Salmonella phage SPAsTU]